MSKSIYAVAGIGLLGCLALSLMMQHLVKALQDGGSSPVARELQEMCSEQLEGRVDVSSRRYDGVPTLVVRVRTKPGVDRERFARSVSSLLWRQAYQLEQPPEQMRFEVAGREGELPVVVVSRSPGLRGARLRRERPGADDAPPPATPPRDK